MYKRFKKKKKLVKRNKGAFLFKLCACVNQDREVPESFHAHTYSEGKKKISADLVMGILKFRDILEREAKEESS